MLSLSRWLHHHRRRRLIIGLSHMMRIAAVRRKTGKGCETGRCFTWSGRRPWRQVEEEGRTCITNRKKKKRKSGIKQPWHKPYFLLCLVLCLSLAHTLSEWTDSWRLFINDILMIQQKRSSPERIVSMPSDPISSPSPDAVSRLLCHFSAYVRAAPAANQDCCMFLLELRISVPVMRHVTVCMRYCTSVKNEQTVKKRPILLLTFTTTTTTNWY